MLTAERARELLHYDLQTGKFAWLYATSKRVKVSDEAGNIGNHGYRKIQIDKRQYLAHRLAWLWMTGSWPKYQIDHINCDKVDNSWCNLREATPSQNQGNTRAQSNNKSSFKGVYLCKGTCKWKASIKVAGKSHNLGLFPTPEAAHAAYIVAAEKAFGEFARAA